MFNPTIYENSQPDGFSVLEIVEPALPERAGNHLRTFVPLQRTELRGTIMGPLASLCLTQIFCFDRQRCADVIEARYRFPLPGDAAITAVTVRFGEVEIAARLEERGAAEAAYAEAKAGGRQAVLTTRETPDLFTLQVAGIQPDQPVVIETAYVQLAHIDRRVENSGAGEGNAISAPGWSLRIPLTTAPRYARSDERHSRAAEGQPLALLRDPGHRFVLDLAFHEVATVSSPTHALVATPELVDDPRSPSAFAATDEPSSSVSTSLRVHLADGEIVPDRDCLLRWSPPQVSAATTLKLLTHRDEANNRLYFLALITPPVQRPATSSQAASLQAAGPTREVTLLVDHSGSMSGPKWAAADWAVEHFLYDLQPADTFALAMFHYETRWFASTLQPAAPTTLDHAVQWLKAQQDSGGTELGVALEQALGLPRSPKNPTAEVARHLLIVTDAAVSDAARILRLAGEEAVRTNRRRISVLCIDAAPNAFLANELAERGGGVARFLTSDPTQQDIVTALDEVLLDWGEPLLVNLQLSVNQPDVTVSGHREVPMRSDGDQRTIIDLGDLVAGRAQWMVGCLPLDVAEAQGKTLTFDLFAGTDAQERLATQLLTLDSATPTASASSTAAIKALFGARRINALEYLMLADLDRQALATQLARLGYEPTTLLTTENDPATKRYAENRRHESAAIVRPLLVQEALDYGLASAETAFIATRSEAGELVTTSVDVANALPTGWSADFLTGVTAAPSGFRAFHSSAAMPTPLSAPAPTTDQGTGRGMRAKLRQMVPSLLPQPQASLSAAALPASTTRATAASAQSYELFCGQPGQDLPVVPTTADEFMLFDSATMPDPLPATATFTALMLRPQDDATAASLRQLLRSHTLTLALYIEDLVAPRATIRLRDLLQGTPRPLNLRREDRATVRITLFDPTNILQEKNVAFSLVMTTA